MSKLVNVPLEIAAGSFVADPFAECGMKCIMLLDMEVDPDDLEPGQTISFAGLKWWGSGSQAWTLSAASPSHSIVTGTGPLAKDACCWSWSHGEKLSGHNAGPGAVTINLKAVIGTIDDCPAMGEASSSGIIEGCNSSEPWSSSSQE